MLSKNTKNTDFFSKRLFDLVFSSAGLIILSPLFLLTAIFVKLDSRGPIFFRQKRVGRSGKVFNIYKFRTMVRDAERLGPRFVTTGSDTRVTRIGKILRKFYIDELPQLINILKGEMSFVGPRPEVPDIVRLYNDSQKGVLSARPGMTGYAFLEFYNEGDILKDSSDLYQDYIKKIMPQKLELDLKYINEKSLCVDFSIILETILKAIGKIKK